MKPPKIVALDLDEVIVETAPGVLRYYNKRYGTNVQLADYYKENPKTWGVSDIDTMVSRVNSYADTKEYLSQDPIKEAIDIIHQLQQKYKLYIITGRLDSLEKITRKWLKKHFPEIFDDVIFSNFFDITGTSRRPKGDICKELGVDVLIDDHLEHIAGAASHGVQGLLFGNYPWNQTKELPENVRRVKDWKEVADILL